MAKYKLVVSGWEAEASAHAISHEQYDKIKKHKEDNGIHSFHDMMEEIENIVRDYSRFNGNLFSFSGAIAYEDETFLNVEDENGKVVLSFVLGDIDFVELENEPYGASLESLGNEYVIFALDENEGTLYQCEFESDEEPKIEDFTYSESYIDGPDTEMEVVEDFYFKGNKLEKDFDICDTSGKYSKTDIYLT